jgi:hypothetical protein
MSLNLAAYNYNKKVWHTKYNPFNKYQLHHIYNRQGVALCCLRLFYPAPAEHQLDSEFVGSLREKFRADYLSAKANYNKKTGCLCLIFTECNDCYFFTLDKTK